MTYRLYSPQVMKVRLNSLIEQEARTREKLEAEALREIADASPDPLAVHHRADLRRWFVIDACREKDYRFKPDPANIVWDYPFYMGFTSFYL